jgi:hypothetical protein
MIDEVISLYTKKKLSVHKIAKLMSVGHKKISTILKENDIPIRNRGGQVKYVTTKADYSFLTDKILVCKTTDKKFEDVFNKSGCLTTHIKTNYPDIVLPSEHKRRMLFKVGKIWYLDFFTVTTKEETLPKRNCKYCSWQTTDVNNKTGCYEVHLKEAHKKDIVEYIKEFPEESSLHPNTQKKIEKELLFHNKDNFVLCKVCGVKCKIITNTHLKKHNLTQEEYKLLYGTKIISEEQRKILQAKMIDLNTNVITSNFTSIYEDQIKEFLEINNIPYERNNRKILNGQEIDFYLPILKLGIEHHGLKHHTHNFGKKERGYHLDKTKKCAEQGIHLIQIFEDEMVFKKDLVFSKLLHIINKKTDNEIIHARKCEIREIDSVLKNLFLEKHHIQGANKSPIKLGAFYGDRLIAVMCFDNVRGMNKTTIKNLSHEYELSRFCVDNNVICSGIAHRLLKYFIGKYNPTKIISMADRRWSNETDNIYLKLGFTKVKAIPPDYWYYNEIVSRFKRFHKFNFGKRNIKKKFKVENIDANTEWGWMKSFGWDWVWDCGKLKYEMLL